MLKIPNFTHDKIDASALPSQCHLYWSEISTIPGSFIYPNKKETVLLIFFS
jgi:hypothetical protein